MDNNMRTGLKYAMMIAAVVGVLVLLLMLGGPWYASTIAPHTDGEQLEGLKGFFFGWIHAALLPLHLVMSLVNDKYTIYQGAGAAYNIGFFLGVGTLSASSRAA